MGSVLVRFTVALSPVATSKRVITARCSCQASFNICVSLFLKNARFLSNSEGAVASSFEKCARGDGMR